MGRVNNCQNLQASSQIPRLVKTLRRPIGASDCQVDSLVPQDTGTESGCDNDAFSSSQFELTMGTGVDAMREKLLRARLMLVVLLAVPRLALSQAEQQNGTLVVSGQPGQAAVLHVNGRSYVDVEALARLTNGSLGFKGNQITLTLPASGASTPTATRAASQASISEFSVDFLKAGVEEMAVIREWRSALVNAVQNGYPVADKFVADYQAQARKNLSLVSVAASTDSDRRALQLLSNEFDNMQKLSNKVLAARKNMNYISRDALKDAPLDQQILNCERSLASMAASGQFQDDGSCH